MTVNTIKIELTCNGRTLVMGPNEGIDITKVTGLESSELEISTSDNALVDGVSVDGKKISKRPIHIEAKFRSSRNNPENRAAVIKFFNPKYTGKALITNMGVSRNINYELEGCFCKSTEPGCKAGNYCGSDVSGSIYAERGQFRKKHGSLYSTVPFPVAQSGKAGHE